MKPLIIIPVLFLLSIPLVHASVVVVPRDSSKDPGVTFKTNYGYVNASQAFYFNIQYFNKTGTATWNTITFSVTGLELGQPNRMIRLHPVAYANATGNTPFRLNFLATLQPTVSISGSLGIVRNSYANGNQTVQFSSGDGGLDLIWGVGPIIQSVVNNGAIFIAMLFAIVGVLVILNRVGLLGVSSRKGAWSPEHIYAGDQKARNRDMIVVMGVVLVIIFLITILAALTGRL